MPDRSKERKRGRTLQTLGTVYSRTGPLRWTHFRASAIRSRGAVHASGIRRVANLGNVHHFGVRGNFECHSKRRSDNNEGVEVLHDTTQGMARWMFRWWTCRGYHSPCSSRNVLCTSRAKTRPSSVQTRAAIIVRLFRASETLSPIFRRNDTRWHPCILRRNTNH